jgi:hypothetical protein
MRHLLVRVFSTAILIGAASGQDNAHNVAEVPAAGLQPVFDDSFATDTRADYTISGDVAWSPGRLTLAEGASIERSINGGARARIQLWLEFPPLTDSQPESELRVWFILDGATNCYVRV